MTLMSLLLVLQLRVKEEVIIKLSVKFPNGNFAISSSHGWKNKEYTENKVKKKNITRVYIMGSTVPVFKSVIPKIWPL